MMFLRYHDFNGGHRLKIFNNLKDSLLGTFYAVTGSFEDDTLRATAVAGETDGNPAEIFNYLSQDFALTSDKVSVMFHIHIHFAFYDVVLELK
jgi:hypothetical protein